MVSRWLNLTAAVIGVLLISAAFLFLLAGLIVLYGREFEEAAQNVVPGVMVLVALTLLPGLLVYRFAGRRLSRSGVRRMHLALGVSTAGLLAIFLIPAAVVRNEVTLDDGMIMIHGPLNLESVRAFRQLRSTAGLAGARVRLRSPGGDVYAAMAIGRDIHRLGLDVEVDGSCYSSCANYLFTAGRNKYLQSADQVHFHGGALQPNYLENTVGLLRDGGLTTSGEVADAAERREIFGLRADFPFNTAAFLLAEQAFFEEIGVSPLTPAYGQHGEYAAWFDDGVHDAWYYLSDDFALLGVQNVRIADAGSSEVAESDNGPFRARVSAGALEAMQAELTPLIQQVEAAMPFGDTPVWVR